MLLGNFFRRSKNHEQYVITKKKKLKSTVLPQAETKGSKLPLPPLEAAMLVFIFIIICLNNFLRKV